MKTTTKMSLAQKTAVLVLLDMYAGVKGASDDAAELLADLGVIDATTDNELIAEVWYQRYDPNSTPEQMRLLLSRRGFLRWREGRVHLTTLARGLRADEVAGRL